jgi:hypothetical protein
MVQMVGLLRLTYFGGKLLRLQMVFPFLPHYGDTKSIRDLSLLGVTSANHAGALLARPGARRLRLGLHSSLHYRYHGR